MSVTGALPDMNDGSNVGALIIRNAVGGILYYRYDRSARDAEAAENWLAVTHGLFESRLERLAHASLRRSRPCHKSDSTTPCRTRQERG